MSGGTTSRWHTRAQHRLSAVSPPAPQQSQDQARAPSPPVPPHVRGMRRFEARMGLEESHHFALKAKLSKLNPPVDMRMIDYVTTYDTNLMCPICRCPFVDPVVLYDCDHTFCRECLQQAWTEYTPGGLRGNCPSCRAVTKLIGRGAVSKILLNILDELVVKCPRGEEGCSATMRRGEVKDHLSIYCGYHYIECPTQDCVEPVRRKDGHQCMHHDVSCIDCHETMTLANIETHWKKECPDRKVQCELCQSSVYYREFETHTKNTCPAISIPCIGASYGCSFRSKRGTIDLHTKSCTYAVLAPLLDAQQRRLERQEEKQAILDRKLQILEGGFRSIQATLNVNSSVDALDSGSGTLLPPAESITGERLPTILSAEAAPLEFDIPAPRPLRSTSPTYMRDPTESRDEVIDWPPPVPATHARTPPGVLNERNVASDYLSSVQDFDMVSPFASAASRSEPYASPVHHLLSLHENLREEVARVSSALQELDGRHSMLILNENMRLKEELAYMSGQVASVSRQVGWLTSVRLQEQSRAQGPSGHRSEGLDAASSSQSAVSNARLAIGGAAALINAGREGLGMGRRPTDEGRTKL